LQAVPTGHDAQLCIPEGLWQHQQREHLVHLELHRGNNRRQEGRQDPAGEAC
jgi:hypothetical protein